MKGSASSNPVYKPTPINILEKKSREHANSKRNSPGVSNQHPFSTISYQPTPISELEKYSVHAAEDCTSLYSPLSVPSWSAAVDRPSYSPVVKSLPTFQHPSPSISPFYQPSPAYPPIVNDLPLSSSPNESKKTTKSKFLTPKIPPKRIKPGDEVEADDNPEEKRNKILTLYHDLYDDVNTDEDAHKQASATPNLSETTQSQITTKGNQTQLQKAPTEDESGMKLNNSATVPSSGLPSTRPTRPLRPSSKIPMPIRNRYLDHFVEACLRISSSEPEAYALALREEQSCHDKAANRLVYLNAVINSLKILKSQPMFVMDPAPTVTPKVAVKQKRATALKEVPEIDWDQLIKSNRFYVELEKCLLSDEELVSNGFPRPDKSENSKRGRAVLRIPDAKKAANDACSSDQRFCCRCGTVYCVNKFGEAVTATECTYHWGKLINRRVQSGGRDMRYTCCQAEAGQQGCEVGLRGHVYDSNKWYDLDGYISTLPPLPSADDSRVNVYALDCEMVYTTGGIELARVTIVDVNLNVVLERIVRPDHPVVDANSRFSGLKIVDLEATSTHITDVQMELLHLFDEDTILIGHSLESDLVALKLIHDKVVDTSLIFPHRLGLPYKRALRNVVSEVLEQIIQQDEVGHDSKEDAIACMRLMQYRVKEAIKRSLRANQKIAVR